MSVNCKSRLGRYFSLLENSSLLFYPESHNGRLGKGAMRGFHPQAFARLWKTQWLLSANPSRLLHTSFPSNGRWRSPTALHPGLTLGERRAYVPERILLSPFITQVNYFLHEGGDPHGMQPSYLLRSLKSLCQTELSQHIIVISFILMEIGHYHVYNWSADQTHQRHESMHLWALDLITRGSICYYSKLVFT